MKLVSKLYDFLIICTSLTCSTVYASNNFHPTVEQDYSNGVQPFNQSHMAVDLGMNNVPALDQGWFGGAVVFATTAALDAFLERGDFIDQSCIEALIPFVSEETSVINVLQSFGVVEKEENQNKCSQPISMDEYKTLVHPTVTVAHVQYTEFSPTLDRIQKSLDNGRRVLLKFQLKGNADPIAVQGFDLLIDGKKYDGGLWACKQPGHFQNYCDDSTAGHEVVVIGYDNTQQLLKIRNSWGAFSGEHGDFYMTYDFFAKMAVSTTEIYLK